MTAKRIQAKRILLVDDEALVALDAEDALIAAGYRVVGPADRLGTALDLLQNEDVDAAVLDVNLAGVLVWPLADALYARKIPFLLLTGFGKGLDVPLSCRKAPLIAKPLRPEEMLAALATLLIRRTAASHTACPARSPEAAAQN